MRFIIQNIRLWVTVALCFLAIVFVTWNKASTAPRKSPTYPGAIPTQGTQVTETSIRIDPNFVNLYLSFDDGPTAGSWNLDRIASSDSVKISVFIIGKYVFKNDSNWQLFQLYQQNPFIEIENHSYTHANNRYHSYYENPGEVKRDFLMNYDTLGLRHKIARLPGRNCWHIKGKSRFDLEDGKAAADMLSVYGYRVFGWDIEWHYDGDGRVKETASEMYDKLQNITVTGKSFTTGNIVILCHDPMLTDPYNESELKLFIKRIKMSGDYRFQFLSSYP